MTTMNITRGTGVRFKFDNGYELSVQIGPGNYCENYGTPFGRTNEIPTLIDCETAEIAVFLEGEWCNPNPPFTVFKDGYTDARAYVPVNEVLDLINTLRALPSPS